MDDNRVKYFHFAELLTAYILLDNFIPHLHSMLQGHVFSQIDCITELTNPSHIPLKIPREQ